MNDLTQAIIVAIGVVFWVGLLGAAFAFGFACVCRRMQWAPVNVTVNINKSDEAQ